MKYDVKVRGQEKVLAELSERLEKRNKRAIDRALMLGAQHIVKKSDKTMHHTRKQVH